MLNLIFFILEDFTNSDRTPPYIDTYLQLFPKLWKFWKKRSPIRMNLILLLLLAFITEGAIFCLEHDLVRSYGLMTTRMLSKQSCFFLYLESIGFFEYITPHQVFRVPFSRVGSGRVSFVRYVDFWPGPTTSEILKASF